MDPATLRKIEKERQLVADGRKGQGMGEEPNHTTGKKAWPSINHSILFSSNGQVHHP
jgi:hypothetical protein